MTYDKKIGKIKRRVQLSGRQLRLFEKKIQGKLASRNKSGKNNIEEKKHQDTKFNPSPNPRYQMLTKCPIKLK